MAVIGVEVVVVVVVHAYTQKPGKSTAKTNINALRQAIFCRT
jgi:hypothetical protein